MVDRVSFVNFPIYDDVRTVLVLLLDLLGPPIRAQTLRVVARKRALPRRAVVEEPRPPAVAPAAHVLALVHGVPVVRAELAPAVRVPVDERSQGLEHLPLLAHALLHEERHLRPLLVRQGLERRAEVALLHEEQLLRVVLELLRVLPLVLVVPEVLAARGLLHQVVERRLVLIVLVDVEVGLRLAFVLLDLSDQRLLPFDFELFLPLLLSDACFLLPPQGELARLLRLALGRPHAERLLLLDGALLGALPPQEVGDGHFLLLGHVSLLGVEGPHDQAVGARRKLVARHLWC